MNKKLFLDDIRDPKDVMYYIQNNIYWQDWFIVRDYDEFVLWIESNGLPDLISFDHDLADEHYTHPTDIVNYPYKEKTGFECAKWLVEYCEDNELKLPECMVHSANPIGADNINTYLKNVKKHLNL